MCQWVWACVGRTTEWMWSKVLVPGFCTLSTRAVTRLHNGATLHGSCKSTPLFPRLPPSLLLFHISQPTFCFLSFDLFTAEPAFQCSFNPSRVHSLEPPTSNPHTILFLRNAAQSLRLLRQSSHQNYPLRQRSGSYWFTVCSQTFQGFFASALKATIYK